MNDKEAVLKELCLILKTASPQTSDYLDALSSLNILYPGISVGALDIIDKGNVVKLQTSSGRYVFQIVGSSGLLFHCFDVAHPSCCCSIFKSNTWKRVNSAVLCKHILAVKLALYLDCVTVRNISEESHYVRLVKSSMFDELVT